MPTSTVTVPLNRLQNQVKESITARALFEALKKVRLHRVRPVATDRHIPRKVQAQLARALFRRLGLKGISVTTPNYSMASTVNVKIPKIQNVDEIPWEVWSLTRDGVANQEARDKVMSILAKAFPNHDDRSDYGADYHDSKWSY